MKLSPVIKKCIYPAGLALLALLVFAYIFDPKIDSNGDNCHYYILASSLAAGNGYTDMLGNPSALFPPGYPLLMVPLRLVTDSIVAQKVLNLLFLFASVLLLFSILLAEGLKPALAFIAGAAVLVTPHLLEFSTMMMSEASCIFFITLSLWAFLHLPAGNRVEWRSPWLLLFLFATIYTFYIRTQAIAFVAAFVVALLLSQRWRLGLALSGTFVAALLPWVLRNAFWGLEQSRYVNQVDFSQVLKIVHMLLAQVIPDSIIPFFRVRYDYMQYEYDVIFVVAGTNKRKGSEIERIGAPADSLNSLVVNAVNAKGEPASYTRRGPVLSFFYKPDVCYYGGDGEDKIVVCEPLGKATVSGTSFAAPWITRKVAYLIHVMGFSREVAKALIIDSAAGWDRKDNISFKKGYGIVPKRIEDILYSENDEIRFIMNGSIDEYEIYTYNIPVPQDMNAQPFFAKATLTYFPKSDRNQGVDYTSTEMDIHFGRIMEQNGKAVIKAIDLNKQAEEGLNTIYEENARRLYRKWDNVKHISEALKERGKPRKAYQSGMWGLSIKTKERLDPKAGRGLQFGVVVTLKEMNGVNRIDEFIKLCMLRGWIVNRVDVHNQIDVYTRAEEEIEFD